MRKQHFLLAIIIGTLLVLNTAVLTIPPCSAGLVYWSDDFSDGNYYPDWNVTIGSWAAGIEILRSIGSSGVPPEAIIYHSCIASYGTWSFDLLYSDTGTKVWIGFMHHVLCTSVFDAGMQGYILELNGTHINLIKSTDTTLIELDSASYAPTSGTYDIQISRLEDGTFEVRVEDLVYLTALDTSYTTSTYFTLGSSPHGYGIDNIIVSGSDGLGTATTPMIPGFPAAAIVVGVLIALSLTLLRRRRTQA